MKTAVQYASLLIVATIVTALSCSTFLSTKHVFKTIQISQNWPNETSKTRVFPNLNSNKDFHYHYFANNGKLFIYILKMSILDLCNRGTFPFLLLLLCT